MTRDDLVQCLEAWDDDLIVVFNTGHERKDDVPICRLEQDGERLRLRP